MFTPTQPRLQPAAPCHLLRNLFLALGIASWIASSSPSAAADSAAAPSPIPPPAQILANLNKAHPRLLATSNDFARLKEQIGSDPVLKAWATNLHAKAVGVLKEQPSRYEIPDGKRLLATSRRVMSRVYTLAMAYRLERDPQYAARAWQELSAAADFQDWNPRHFLDTAEMTHAFAIGYDWLYDAWTPDQRVRLQKAIVKLGLHPGLAVYRSKNPGWAAARHNWNQVCNGGLGMGALALADVEPEIAGEVLQAALKSIPLAMSEFAPDGAWKEGPSYWCYATTYNVVFLAALQTALGTDFNLSQMPAVDQTGYFPIYATGPTGRSFNFADSGDHAMKAPQMFWLATRFKQPLFAWYEIQNAAPAALDLLWYQPAGPSPKAARLPLDKYFRGAEIATLRSAWENPQALYAGLKAGDNRANHSHLDLGSFVFDALGVRWAADLGADNYNLPGYFGRQRWLYYRLRAEGHNTLVVSPPAGPDNPDKAPGLEPDQDPAAVAKIIRFQPAPDRPYAIADITPAYAKHTRKVWRGIALLSRDKLLVQDEIQADKPVSAWWFMHTQAKIRIDPDRRGALLQQDGKTLRAQILSPAAAAFRSLEAAPLPDSPHPEGQEENEGFRKLAIPLTGITNCRVAVLLAPLPAGQTNVPTIKLSPLSEW